MAHHISIKTPVVLPLAMDYGPIAAVVYAHALMDQARLCGAGPVQLLWLELTLCFFSL